MDKPKELEIIDLRALREAVNDYLEFLESDYYHEDRIDNYENDIFEKAIETFYPEQEIWGWVNMRGE